MKYFPKISLMTNTTLNNVQLKWKYLLRELLSSDLDECSRHSPHAGLDVVEGNAAGPDGVLVLVGVNA